MEQKNMPHNKNDTSWTLNIFLDFIYPSLFWSFTVAF